MKRVPFLLMLAAGTARAADGQPGDQAARDVGRPDYAALTKLFEYDRGAPLDVQETGRDEVPGLNAEIRHVTFASPVAGRVTASIIVPTGPAANRARGGTPPYAGIVFMHWGQGNRTEFLYEGALYAGAGAVSIVLDAPWARPEPWKQAGEGYLTQPELPRKMYIQTVIDLRRAVDVLIARGWSMGARAPHLRGASFIDSSDMRLLL